ncbi:MAG TPA: anti-CBASS Acb1 family protein [Nitrospiraceae bacterium]
MSETNGHTTELTEDTLRAMAVQLTRLTMAGRFGSSFDGLRNLYDLFGWKRSLTYQDFKNAYTRQGVAYRVVGAYPDAAWAQPPSVKEVRPATPRRSLFSLIPAVPEPPSRRALIDQSPALQVQAQEESTPFEAAWEALEQRLRLYATLQRLDTLANLGQYAVLLLGLRGQPNDLRQPATPVRSPDDLLYVTPYSEEYVTIQQFVQDPQSSDYAKPELYKIETKGTGKPGTTAVPSGGTLMVHASRVIHVAIACLDDEIYGIPRLEPIYNNICDLDKVVGSSAEMFFRDAKRRIGLQMREGYSFKSQAAAEETARKAEEFQHGLRDFLDVMGMDIVNLPGTTANPKEQVAAQLAVVTMATGIPKRILEGSERGELSSQQDAEEWKSRVTQYQRQVGDQKLLHPLIERLLALQVLPQPTHPWEVQWENLFSLSEEQQAVVAKDVATALAEITKARMQGLQAMSDERFLETYLHLDPEDDPWRVPSPAEGLQPGPEEV